MSTITGNLDTDTDTDTDTDPEAVQAGRAQIVKLRVIEHTGEYRQGSWSEHDAAAPHSVGVNTLS